METTIAETPTETQTTEVSTQTDTTQTKRMRGPGRKKLDSPTTLTTLTSFTESLGRSPVCVKTVDGC